VDLAVVPARGGSKRIARKNVRPFAGRPMIEWPLAAALDSRLFGRVVVSTDDAEIAEVARAAGAEVPFLRPPDLADDHATTGQVMAHATRWAIDEGLELEAVCCLYATAPFVTPDVLAEGRAELTRGGFDFVLAAARFSYSVQRGFVADGSGGMQMLFPEHRLTRSQDLPPVYHDAGQFYWAQPAAWLEERPVFGPASSFLELPLTRAQDIDSPEDWILAERLFELERATGSTP
jgi:pseudaminic acid cytidylyltransferase